MVDDGADINDDGSRERNDKGDDDDGDDNDDDDDRNHRHHRTADVLLFSVAL